MTDKPQTIVFYIDVNDWDRIDSLHATTNPTMKPYPRSKRYTFNVELPGDAFQSVKAEEAKK